MEIAKIKALITSIGRAAAKLRKDIQTAAVECLIHAVQHGDVTLADNLIEAVGKGTRKASLRAWFELNGPFVVQTGKGTFGLDAKKAKKLRTEPEADLRARLLDVPWEDAAPEPKPVSVLDVSVQFDKFLDRLNKLANEPGVQVRNRELLDLLVNETKTWHNEQIIKSAKALTPEQIEKIHGVAPVVHGQIQAAGQPQG